MAGRYGASETMLSRHETWQRAFGRLVFILGIALLTAFTAVAMAYWSINHKPAPRYFAAREDGGILPIESVESPFLEDSQVTTFVAEALSRAFTLSFATWQQDKLESETYFTKPAGSQAYVSALIASGIKDYIDVRKLTSTAVASGAVITSKGPNEQGVYSWIMETPLTITYESTTEKLTMRQIAQVEVVRVPTWKMSRGIGIERITMRRGE